jgi:hypothetical protein
MILLTKNFYGRLKDGDWDGPGGYDWCGAGSYLEMGDGGESLEDDSSPHSQPDECWD